jgi:hypothetical protein
MVERARVVRTAKSVIVATTTTRTNSASVADALFVSFYAGIGEGKLRALSGMRILNR